MEFVAIPIFKGTKVIVTKEESMRFVKVRLCTDKKLIELREMPFNNREVYFKNVKEGKSGYKALLSVSAVEDIFCIDINKKDELFKEIDNNIDTVYSTYFEMCKNEAGLDDLLVYDSILFLTHILVKEVIGYLNPSDISSTVENIRETLKLNDYFLIFDRWIGIGVNVESN